MGIPAITIELTDDQLAAIEPVRQKVSEAANAGAPGMLLAQIINGEMKVFFANQFQASQFQRAMGTRVGKTTADI
jgi:hypothetical protein